MTYRPGTMMDQQLLLKTFLWRAEQVYGANEIVTAVGDDSHRYTYERYGERVRRLAGALRGLGVGVGDRVGTLGWNTSRHLEAYYAVPCMGAVLHTCNLRLFPDQIAYTINHAGDRVLLVDPDQLALVEELRPKLETVEAFVVMADTWPATALDDIHGYEELLAAATPVATFPDLDERSAAATCYTSATTGDPKGVVYTQRSMVLHSLATALHGSFGVREDMSLLAISPMFHVNSWGLPHAAVMQGTKLVLPGARPVASTYLRLIAEERVTHAYGAVTVGIQVREAIEADPAAHDLSSLEVFLLGGQAPPRGLMEFYEQHAVDVPQAWGMTESSPLVTWNYLRPAIAAADRETRYATRTTQGIPLPLVELEVHDEDDNPLPWDGQSVGELVLRSPWVAASYSADPERSAAAVRDGWYHTGDIGVVRPDGYVRLSDRAKDLIKSGGEWISSVELENALMAHPGVAEAAVVAVPDDRWLERPLACVVPRVATDPPTAEDLRAFLAARVAKWWVPDRFELVDEIPKTGVGKFDKKVLRTRFGEPAHAPEAPDA